jgi:hypothetical protein
LHILQVDYTGAADEVPLNFILLLLLLLCGVLQILLVAAVVDFVIAASSGESFLRYGATCCAHISTPAAIHAVF